MEEYKNILRKKYLRKRNNLNKDDIISKSSLIVENILKLDEYNRAATIFAYMSFGSEVRTDTLINECFKSGKTVAVPRIIPNTRRMEFYVINSFINLTKNKFGIPEPQSDYVIYPDEKTVMVVPGVVFSKDNIRIGYGGGYYDRYLAGLPALYKIGVCFQMQIAKELPKNEHDICMDIIITEQKI